MTLFLALLWFAACNTPAPEVPPAPAAAVAAPGDVPAPADVAAPPADATTTPSGLAYKVLTPGTGTEHPTDIDGVKLNYTGWTTDGKMFDTSTKRKKPAQFKLKGVIPGWTEGVQLMVVGDKMRFWIPSALAYGDTPKRPGAPAGPLTFDIELISFKDAPANAPGKMLAPGKGGPGGLKIKGGEAKPGGKPFGKAGGKAGGKAEGKAGKSE